MGPGMALRLGTGAESMGAPLGPWDPRMLVAKQREVRVKQERYPEDVWFGPSIFVDISVVCRVYRYSWWNLTLGDWCPFCQSNSPCFVGKTQRFGRWSCWSKSLIANLCGQLLGARWSIWSLSMPIAPIRRPCESLNSRNDLMAAIGRIDVEKLVAGHVWSWDDAVGTWRLNS